jgi:hypothetical protein
MPDKPTPYEAPTVEEIETGDGNGPISTAPGASGPV